MTRKNNQNELWTDEDTMRCINYLEDLRAMREINKGPQTPYDKWSYRLIENDDGSYSHEWQFSDDATIQMGDEVVTKNDVISKRANELKKEGRKVYTSSTRLYRWQKRFVFNLPYPFDRLWFKLVITRE